MEKTEKFSLKNFHDKMYLLTGFAILAAGILTLISYLHLCSEQCAEGHHYLLFGMHFETFGGIFFTGLALAYLLQRHFRIFQFAVPLLFASALGAELMFIIIQKYTIGQWCPVCLGIASCMAIGAAAIFTNSFRNLRREDRMKYFLAGLSNTAAAIAGFVIAFIGVSKPDTMQAAQENIRDSVAFGNKNSKIEVYLFTDWACPACKKLEPSLGEIAKAITPENKLIFVDDAIHPETLNFIPYNLSFILHNKPEYLELRDMLTQLSEKTGAPSEAEITAQAAKLGVKYNEVHYSDVALAVRYYKKLTETFDITATPTMVIINTETKKGKKLAGVNEITKDNVLNSIKLLSAS